MKSKSKIFYLLGYPAVGKFTISTQLAKLTSARLVDNHTINNPIFQLVRKGGRVDITPEVSKYTADVRDTVLNAIQNLADPSDSFIFTNLLIDTPKDARTFEQIKTLAETRQSIFVPVIITCETDALLKRVSSPDREAKLKLTKVGVLKAILDTKPLLPIEHPNLMTLDSTDISVDNAATQIADHGANLAQ